MTENETAVKYLYFGVPAYCMHMSEIEQTCPGSVHSRQDRVVSRHIELVESLGLPIGLWVVQCGGKLLKS